MKYVGIQTQQSRNNFRSLLLLCLFPCLVAGMLYLFCFLLHYISMPDDGSNMSRVVRYSNGMFLHYLPYVMGGVLVWFVIAYFANTSIINSAVGSVPLQRKDNKRVYNLVENLCISQGMKMPKLCVIEDESLNAFASGINERTYTVTLTTGIIRKLNDEELEAVIAHELSHIRNHDVRLLIISIVFVGIFSMVAQMCMQWVYYSSWAPRRRDEKGNSVIIVMLLALLVAAIGYFFALLMRFAISRKREYLADAGSAEMTHNPLALASALRKISGDPTVESVHRADIAQLFIAQPGDQAMGFLGGLNGLFATHPPIQKRIEVLEQF